ncbi:MAG: sigma-70 family RNA polymerase sigma factor [Thermoanaerobaculia bacterium]
MTRAKAQVQPSAEREPDLSVLIGGLVEGDQACLSRLYDATSRLVYSLCLRILSDRSDAEEVTIDVYSQVWRQAARYDRTRGEPVTWLLTLAHSRAIDRLRSRAGTKKREQALDDASEFKCLDADPESASVLAQRARLVRQALSCLSPEQREVIELAYFEGLTHVEIAERIKQPLGTAKSRIRLGMVKLRDALTPAQEGWSM